MQTLMSVMEPGDPMELIEKLNIRTDALIVNQCERNSERLERREAPSGDLKSGQHIRIIERDERGLSKSRNLALNMASDDICIFCDNDVRYEDDAAEVIEEAFLRHPEAGIICFFIERPERHTPVKKREGAMSKKDMMRIFSPEIALRRSAIGDLRFDEDFGAGARYRMGEENIFLFEAARRGISRVYVPHKIAETIPNETSWFTGYDRDFFHNRGAGYEAMDPGMWYPLAWQFIVRKKSLYKETISSSEAYRAMKEGRKEYRDRIANKDQP